MSGGGPPPPDYTASAKLAGVSQGMYDYYRKHFVPVERKLMAESDPARVQAAVKRSVADANQGFTAQLGSAQRERQRFGVTLSAQEQQAESRRNQLARSVTTVGTANNVRQEEEDLRRKAELALANLGRQTASGAIDMLGTSSSLAAQRYQAGLQTGGQGGFLGFLSGI